VGDVGWSGRVRIGLVALLAVGMVLSFRQVLADRPSPGSGARAGSGQAGGAGSGQAGGGNPGQAGPAGEAGLGQAGHGGSVQAGGAGSGQTGQGGSGQGNEGGSGQVGPTTSTTPPAAGVLSLRRLPAASADLEADTRLATGLNAIFADPSVAATQSCLVVADDGVIVYAHDADTPEIPASNMKLLTAFAVLTRLGPSARFTTRVMAAAPPQGGVIDGPLWLVGGGDPLLGTPDWRASEHDWTESVEPVTSLDDLAGAVRSAGVTRVTGGIVGDDSRFEDLRALPTWDSAYLADGEIGPVGALVVDGGFPNRPDRLSADPATEAAGSFLSLLAAHGVQIAEGASHGYAPPGAVQIASIPSAPLSVIVGEMLRESDNLAAEMLLKDMGYEVGVGGTWAASAPLVRAALVAAGIPVAGLVQSDGSGLDRGDRVTCTTLDAVVAQGGPASAALDAGLPLAGVCGTLVGRFLNQPGADRVWGKTGTLAGVDALTGTVTAPVATSCPPDAGPAASGVTFSLIVNQTPSDAAGQSIEDRVGDALSEYPPTVDLASLGLGSSP